MSESDSELRAQRDRLELVLEGTRLGLWDWNPQTNEVVFDERWAQMLGHELSEIEFSLDTWQSRVHPDDLEGAFADLQAHMDGKTKFYENIHRMKHRDGHWVYILDRGRVCEWDEQGNPTRFTGTHTDITAQKEAEIQAKEASRAKSDFLARMSHEIRTPLNGVLGVLQLLENTDLAEEQRRYLDVINESGETLLSTINDILDVSQIEAGKLSIQKDPFDVRSMLRSVHDLYRERALSKGLQYGIKIAENIPNYLLGDNHRIRQVVSNLLSNALKFTEVGGVFLLVNCVSMENAVELCISVTDTGPGIADSTGIWDAFGQADTSNSRRHEGTGLGLAICKQLIGLMGGTISLESEVGQGSCFTAKVCLERVIERRSKSSFAHVVQGRRDIPALDVLVAEDNSVNQLVISGILKGFGQRVTVVNNGLKALEKCKQNHFDIVFMDIHMPEMNGIQASCYIRASISEDKQPRIVVISADAFARDAAMLESAKFDGIITKPFRARDIADALLEV